MGFKRSSIAIIGAGPAGCACAYFASIANPKSSITLFDFANPLHTLLYTGGGRCNLAYAEYDFKELAKFYPRGEKFLYSVFSQFSTADTLGFFNSIGVETYMQDDLRIFPVSNSAKSVREKILNQLNKCNFKREKVLEINKNDMFSVVTDKCSYNFDKVVLSIGGHAGFELAKQMGHQIIEPKPALTGLICLENFKSLQGLTIKNVTAQVFFENKKVVTLCDDILFTHTGISGPLAYKVSSICARLDYKKQNPLVLKFDLLNEEINLQDLLNSNPQKDIKNLVSELVPKSMSEYILKRLSIESTIKCHEVNAKMRDDILNILKGFEINIISPAKDGEIVMSGGVCLNEINSKNMQSKLLDGLYFCGEVIDVDGLCGGFNLQNCWSTAYVAGNSL